MPGETQTQDPSLQAGAVMPGHEDLLQNAMAEVVPLFALVEADSTAAVSDYVTRREAELSQTDRRDSISILQGGTDTYIAPETAMIMSVMFAKPYYLDDKRAYEAAFPYIRSAYGVLREQLPENRAYLNAVIEGVNTGQAMYFGSIAGDPRQRMMLAADIISDEDEDIAPLSVAEFKTSAMCMERAGVAHNGLLVFGVASNFEAGELGVKSDDGSVDTEAHAFLTITGTEGKRYIYDPTNPILVKNEDGGVIAIKPALYPLDTDENGQQEVQLREFTVRDGQTQETRSRTLVYSLQTKLARTEGIDVL